MNINNKKAYTKFCQEIDTVNTLTLDKNTVKNIRANALEILEDTGNVGKAIVYFETQVTKLQK